MSTILVFLFRALDDKPCSHSWSLGIIKFFLNKQNIIDMDSCIIRATMIHQNAFVIELSSFHVQLEKEEILLGK